MKVPPTLLRPILFLAILAIVATTALALRQAQSTLPTHEQAEKAVQRYGPMLGYRVWDGVPHVLFIKTDYFGNRDNVVFDRLTEGRASIRSPLTASWQPSRLWYYIDYTTAPASLGDAHCTGLYYGDCTTDTEVFGQVNSGGIVALELNLKGTWHRYPVSPPGFMLQLDGFRGLPNDYRWLDAESRMVWNKEQDRSSTGTIKREPGFRNPSAEWGVPLPLS